MKLLELSFDLQLAHNALELVLDEGNYLLSDVFFHEYGESDLMVLFATATTAYRLLLPHPHRVAKVSADHVEPYTHGVAKISADHVEPHPHRVEKKKQYRWWLYLFMFLQSPSLASTGDGTVPSVLAFAEEYGFIGSNMAPLFKDASR